MRELYSSKEVLELTGITPRQLQCWDERGIVSPLHRGHRRLYSLDDVTTLTVICELRRRGFSLQRVRRVIRLLQREFSQSLAQTVSSGFRHHLLTDGQDVYVETSSRQIVDLLRNAKQPMLAICLSDTVRQVRADIRAIKKRSQSVFMTAAATRRAQGSS